MDTDKRRMFVANVCIATLAYGQGVLRNELVAYHVVDKRCCLDIKICVAKGKRNISLNRESI